MSRVFFRDIDAFASLKTHVISHLLDKKSERDNIRVWVPACSSGEEAITIAILIDEMLEEANRSDVEVKIFATDINQRAIEKAREGLFAANISVDVPEPYFSKYFTSESKNLYRLNKKIRRQLVFSAHNIIKDPPFSKVDLVSCRNLLIYMNSKLQKTVFNIMHYALNNPGYLFLGDSETISVVDGLFTPIDQRYRIYQKIDVDSSLQISSRLYTATRSRALDHSLTESEIMKQLQAQFQSTLLESYVPPSVIIDAEGEILYHQGDTIKFWSTSTGQSSWNILRIARPELGPPIAVGVNHVKSHNEGRIFNNIEINYGDHIEVFNIHMRPAQILSITDLYIIISFEQHQQTPNLYMSQLDITDSLIENRIRELEDEIKLKDEYIQSTLHQLDYANERLNSITEEFQTSTEELRSSNEELETSREELQAINEELLTMNAELNDKVEQLDQISDDLRNILRSMHTGILLLDEDLKIRVFNDLAAHSFNLIESDTGRSISQLAPLFDYDVLLEDIDETINTLKMKTRDVVVENQILQLRIDPYRTSDGDIDGAIITLIDITERKRIEDELRQNQATLQDIVDTLPVAVHILNQDRDIVLVNDAFETVYGFPFKEGSQDQFENIAFIDVQGQVIDAYQLPSHRAIAGRNAIYNHELGIRDEKGQIKWFSVSAAPLNTLGLSAVVVTADVTEKVHQEQEIRENEQRLSDILINTNTIVFEQDRDLKYTSVFNLNTAYMPEDIVGLYDTDIIPANEAERLSAIKKQVMETEQVKRFDFQLTFMDGVHHFDILLRPKYDIAGRAVIGIQGSGMDITQRKKTELAHKKLTEELQRVLTVSMTSAWEQDLDLVFTRLLNPNPNFRVEDTVGKTDYEVLHPNDVERYVTMKKHVFKTGQPIQVDESLIGGDEKLYYIIRLEPVFDDDGETVVGLIGVSTDITERKVFEQELEFQSHILSNISESIHLVQVDTGNIVYINLRFTSLFGYEHEEIIGRHVSILNDPYDNDPQATAQKIMSDLKKYGYWRGQVGNIKKDGTCFVSLASVSTFTHPSYGEVWVALHQEKSN